MPFPFPKGKARLWLQRARRNAVGACGEPAEAVPTLAETIAWARTIPLAAREAQGFTRLADFARHVKQLREKRAKLSEWRPDPVRRSILDRLEVIIDDREDLTAAAHRIAKFRWQPELYVWWGGGVPHVQDGIRQAHGAYYSKRNIVVPAAWLLARVGSDGNVATRVREADPRPRVLATPHWIERAAAGMLKFSRRLLTTEERAALRVRELAIHALRRDREEHKTPAAWQLKDLYVTAWGRGAILFVGGQRAYQWHQHWPSRAEIAKGAAEGRKQLEETRKRLEQSRKHSQWRAAQDRVLAFAPDAPDTLGWRGWRWDGQVLISPIQGTPWHEATLWAEHWSDSEAVLGEAGIHARRMPCEWLRVDPKAVPHIGRCDVHGIVERFGRYVLGTEGWRAEWVVIRELLAPDAHTALALMRSYPEVRVHIREQEAVQ